MRKEDILNWLTEHKSTTLPGWLNRNPDIKDWVLLQTAMFETKNIMEAVYL